ncbi:MAG: GxxExxY protein [Patescibacteria group bacterium]|jgi:GxxExxY protein
MGVYNTYKRIIHKELSYKIMGILFSVNSELGYGYQEKYYERAIEVYFKKKNIKYKRQMPYNISVCGEIIGKYYLDFLVEDKIILELKRENYFPRTNIEQVKGYLKATGLELAILANFTSRGVKYLRVLNDKNYNL